jgi:ATP-binding cassette subfamily B protein
MAPDDAAQPKIGLWEGLRHIYARMSVRRRRQLLAVLLLMLAGAVAELGTIGSVMPFLALLTSSGGGPQVGGWVFPMFGGSSAGNPLLVAAAVFILFAIVAGLVRLQLARSNRSFIFALGHELTVEIQRRVLLQPYSFHTHRNTSTLLSALHKTETSVLSVLLPLMHAVTSGVIALFVIALLLFVAPVTTLCVGVGLIAIYLLISNASRGKLAANSAILEHAYDERLQIVQESLGGIRDVIVDNAQTLYLGEFEAVDAKLFDARANTEFISIAPHYLIEMAGMVAIAAIAIVTTRQSEGIAVALPVLGALALGAQRLLPLVQQVYAGWSTLEGQRSVFGQVVELLRLPTSDAPAAAATPLQLRDGITLKELSFTYPTRRHPALDRISLSIPRGSMLALVGPTGSGKSTLVDVIMGLLLPGAGRILIDEIPLTDATRPQWHRSVAHVPQSIFLADSSIARNIALSLPDAPVDQQRIVEAAKKAQLHDFVLSLPSGYDTRVGERGIRLSGGQRQRLGIARAVYKGAPILILDEATSALDEATERAVIAALDELRGEGTTIMIVAHRMSTVRHCDLVARLDDGKLVEFGSFAQVMNAGEKVS